MTGTFLVSNWYRTGMETLQGYIGPSLFICDKDGYHKQTNRMLQLQGVM